MSCDADSHCGVDGGVGHCVLNNRDLGQTSDIAGMPNTSDNVVSSVEMFHCHQYGGTIPYTLVCDFRKDCADGSDEDPCKHRSLSALGFLK